MIRLSVVHAPVGPQMGPGLDDDIQEPGIEDDCMYTGESKYDMWDPYGGQGENREYDVPGKKREKRPSKGILDGKKCIAIDFDGTVTADPHFFKDLVASLKKSGSKVYLVTGRSALEREDVESYCSTRGLKFDAIHFYPVPYKFDVASWDALTDSRIGMWKAEILKELGADVMIDDNDIYIRIVASRLPEMMILKPVCGG